MVLQFWELITLALASLKGQDKALGRKRKAVFGFLDGRQYYELYGDVFTSTFLVVGCTSIAVTAPRTFAVVGQTNTRSYVEHGNVAAQVGLPAAGGGSQPVEVCAMRVGL